jgi:hypothetical protein
MLREREREHVQEHGTVPDGRPCPELPNVETARFLAESSGSGVADSELTATALFCRMRFSGGLVARRQAFSVRLWSVSQMSCLSDSLTQGLLLTG